MFIFRGAVLALGAALLCASAGAAALDDVDACAARASADASGLAALEAQCPGLESALRGANVVDNLPDGWRDTLNRGALRDLGALAHRYDIAPVLVPPDPAALAAILAQLEHEQGKPSRSWWDAAKEWLRSWFSGQDPAAAPWLERLLDRIAHSGDLIKIITYMLLAITVVGVGVFVVNELRIAGVLSRRKEPGQINAGTAALNATAEEPQTGDLDAAPLRDQPAILLRMLVARLLNTGQLQTERSLTHRELVTCAAFPDADTRVRFARVTHLAERMLYGSGEGAAAQVSAVIADGRQLLAQLQAAARLQA